MHEIGGKSDNHNESMPFIAPLVSQAIHLHPNSAITQGGFRRSSATISRGSSITPSLGRIGKQSEAPKESIQGRGKHKAPISSNNSTKLSNAKVGYHLSKILPPLKNWLSLVGGLRVRSSGQIKEGAGGSSESHI